MSDNGKRPAYVAAHINEIPFEEGDSPGTEWKPVRRLFDIGSFGTNLARATNAGDVLTHDDETDVRHEELFLIVSGHAAFTVDGEEIDAPAGTSFYVPDPATVRGAVARRPARSCRRRGRARRGLCALGVGYRAAARLSAASLRLADGRACGCGRCGLSASRLATAACDTLSPPSRSDLFGGQLASPPGPRDHAQDHTGRHYHHDYRHDDQRRAAAAAARRRGTRLQVQVGVVVALAVEGGAGAAEHLGPAGPPGDVVGLEVLGVGKHDPGRLLVHDLLHLPDHGLALLGVERTPLLNGQGIVLGVRPEGLVEAADLLGGEAVERLAGVVVGAPVPHGQIEVGLPGASLVVVDE